MGGHNHFWIVWNPQGQNPRHRHNDLEGAIREAKRLAGLNPGREFIVMQSMGTARRVDVEWVDHGGCPF